MAKIAKRAGAARQRSPRIKKTTSKKKKSSTTARASKKVSSRTPRKRKTFKRPKAGTPSARSPQPKAKTQQLRADSEQLTSEELAAIASSVCSVLDDAVELLVCLPALKRVAQVVDECACPPDPAKSPPDWCIIVSTQVQRELEYAIRCVNHAIRKRLHQVANIMGLDPTQLLHSASSD